MLGLTRGREICLIPLLSGECLALAGARRSGGRRSLRIDYGNLLQLATVGERANACRRRADSRSGNSCGPLRAMLKIDRLWDFLQRLTPLSRSCLLSELERLELCGVDMPGSPEIQSKLRAEFRKDGSTQARATSPSRYFFAPLELFLIDGAPEHPNMGRISR